MSDLGLAVVVPPGRGQCCTWNSFYVTCDADGFVTALQFASSGVAGSLPPALFSLPRISQLVLKNNQLSGNIPTAIGNASNIKQIDLSGNQLSGEIPDEIGTSLQRLEQLYLQSNKLTGNLPTSLANLPKLIDIDVSNNYLTGQVPASLLATIPLVQFRQNCFTGLANQGQCLKSTAQIAGQIAGACVGGVVAVVIFGWWAAREFRRVKRAQMDADTQTLFNKQGELCGDGDETKEFAGQCMDEDAF
ncbi:hypothetical protein HDU84_003602 [Entophlyctis sp. JEL0112]|nr:hypothetical protein HDU84_003602 [Entophlyctis sp. JEL0112]